MNKKRLAFDKDIRIDFCTWAVWFLGALIAALLAFKISYFAVLTVAVFFGDAGRRYIYGDDWPEGWIGVAKAAIYVLIGNLFVLVWWAADVVLDWAV